MTRSAGGNMRTCLRGAATVLAYAGTALAGWGVGLALVLWLYPSRLAEAIAIAAGLSFAGAALIVAAKVLVHAVPATPPHRAPGFDVISCESPPPSAEP